MLISYSGFQSAGKTTATYELATLLKKQGYSVNLWSDIPRRSPIPFNEKGSSDTQYWIISKMIQETLELSQIYDFVITDRTPLDCVAYEMAVQGISDELSPAALNMFNLVVDFLKMRDHLILYPIKGFDLVMEKGRTTDTAFVEASRYWFKYVFTFARPKLRIEDVDLTTDSPSDLLDRIF